MEALPELSKDELELLRLAYSRSLTMIQARQLVQDHPWILEGLSDG